MDHHVAEVDQDPAVAAAAFHAAVSETGLHPRSVQRVGHRVEVGLAGSGRNEDEVDVVDEMGNVEQEHILPFFIDQRLGEQRGLVEWGNGCLLSHPPPFPTGRIRPDGR